MNEGIERVEKMLDVNSKDDRKKKYERFVLAALSGLPWVGGVLSAAAAFDAEKDQSKVNELQKLWLQQHQEKIIELEETIDEVLSSFDKFGEETKARIESPEYLGLVRQAFKSWDNAETYEKKQMLRKILSNAGATTIVPDDLIRLFISWIDMYHEAHFKVMKQIYQNPGSTRGDIWDSIAAERPREDSADADLFRYLILELSTGEVIRQERETDSSGRFLKKKKPSIAPRSLGPKVMASAFEDTKPYVLTELGKQFVRYVMEDVMPQIGAGSQDISSKV